MEHVLLPPGASENVKKNMNKFKNHTYWEKWKAYYFYQLGDMYKENMFGPLFRRPPGAIVLRQVWTFVNTYYGKRSSRNTCDVSPLTVKGVQYAKTYASCDPQNGFNFSCLVYIFGIYNHGS